MKFTLLGNPQSTNHIYKRHGNIIYMTNEGRALKESYQWQFKAHYKEKPLSCPLKVELVLYFGDKRIRDIDNYNKLILDAATNILWIDDKQIQTLTISKYYDKENPRIELSTVSVLDC